MATMTKIVNIRTRVAVKTINPPICGTVKGVIMTTGDILKCLCKRALVEEVLPDGSTIKLNMSNYYIDNGAGLDAKKNMPSSEKKPVDNPARFKVPVSPATNAEKQVVETKTEEDNGATAVDDVAENVAIEAEAEPIEDVFVTGMSVEGDDTCNDIDATVTETATDITVTQNTNNNTYSNKKKKHR